MAFENEEEFDLFKSRAHKYIKRTGSPGNYQYWYKLPDGRIVAGDDDQQKAGRKEHALRLLVARAKGKHSMSNKEIAEHTGYHRDVAGDTDDAKKTKAAHNLRGDTEGMKRAGKRKLGRTPTDVNEAIIHGHNFEDHHVDEAHHHDTESEEYKNHVRSNEGAAPTPATPPRSRTRNVRPIREEIAAIPDAAPARTPRARRARTPEATAATVTEAERMSPEMEAALGRADREAAEAKQAEIEKLRGKLAGMGIDLGAEEAPAVEMPEPQVAAPAPSPAEVKAKAKAAKARARALAQAIGPDAPAARAMASADPVFDADEAPIREAIAAQREGKNPYLENAKKIFNRIHAHIPEKNRISFQNFLDVLGDSSWEVGTPLAESEVKAAYEAHRTPAMMTWAALKTAMPTYKGLYHDMDEILGNAPLNPEVERMKRGFGRKQFERMRPYVKNQWHLDNPDAPPPYPTFGDLKSWNEFGTRPEWVSPRAQLAVPKEVHDASPKDEAGKVQLPPKWMPIHLSPLWNYASKIRSDYTANPNSNQVNGSSLNLDLGTDLGSQIMNSLRKYVQARGGASQLVDIPAQKLASVGLSHNDIFKSLADHDYSDKAMKKILTTKIIDPVAVAPFVEAELKPKEVKKSWALVADIRLPEPVVEEALVKSETEIAEEIRKSQLIKAIKAKRAKLAQMGIRG